MKRISIQLHEAWCLVLAWLPPADISRAARASSVIAGAARAVTAARAADAARGSEQFPVPFLNSLGSGPRYAYFEYLRQCERGWNWSDDTRVRPWGANLGRSTSKDTANEEERAETVRTREPSTKASGNDQYPAIKQLSEGATGDCWGALENVIGQVHADRLPKEAKEKFCHWCFGGEQANWDQDSPQNMGSGGLRSREMDVSGQQKPRINGCDLDICPCGATIEGYQAYTKSGRLLSVVESSEPSIFANPRSNDPEAPTPGPEDSTHEFLEASQTLGVVLSLGEPLCSRVPRAAALVGDGLRRPATNPDPVIQDSDRRQSEEDSNGICKWRAEQPGLDCIDSWQPEDGPECIMECGPACGCGPQCSSRLSQRGLSVTVAIVRDSLKGWGVRAEQDVPGGAFVCEYAGELLTTKEARERQAQYDSMKDAKGQPVASYLMVVREHLPSGLSSLRVNIDPSCAGNVGRFINHSCDGGNLMAVLVRASGSLVPRVGFFARRDIRKGEELTYAYGGVLEREDHNGGGTRRECFCGSPSCRKVLPFEST